VNHLNLAVLLS